MAPVVLGRPEGPGRWSEAPRVRGAGHAGRPGGVVRMRATRRPLRCVEQMGLRLVRWTGGSDPAVLARQGSATQAIDRHQPSVVGRGA